MDKLSTTDAGVIFIGVILILREVFAFVVKRKNGTNKTTQDDCLLCIKKIAQQTDDLYRWHDVRDDEGIPIWYVRKSLEKAIDNLSENVAKQTVVLQEQSNLLKTLQRPEFRGN